MFLQAPVTYRSSFMAAYLNGFQVDPTRGSLTVSRVFLHDDVDPGHLTIAKERFEEHRASQVAEEMEEVFQGVQSGLQKRRKEGESYPGVVAGAWRMSLFVDKILTMAGPGGRLIEVQSAPNEFTLRVGHSSDRLPFHDRQLRYSLSVDRSGGEPRLRCEYDFGFGSASFAGLLEFLGLELTTERLEWIQRDRLWQSLKSRLASDGFQFPANRSYRADHHGLYWKATSPDGDPLEGQFWLEDEYPSLHFNFPAGLSALPPSFQPLWDRTQAEIRHSETKLGFPRASSARPSLGSL